MKLEIEIKDEVFRFHYEIGSVEKVAAECPLSAEALICFANLLNKCWHIKSNDMEEKIRRVAGEVALAMAKEGEGKNDSRKTDL